MKRRPLFYVAVPFIVLLFVSTFAATAMNFQILHSFQNPPSGPWAPLIRGPDGLFYGTTDSGGSQGYGTVYRTDTNGAFTIIHNFGSESSEAPLTLAANGLFYGNSYFSGSNNLGTVFTIDTNGNYTT